MTLKPITDRAEVALDFPDKAYMGSFGRASAFEVRTDAEGAMLRLVRTGEEKRIVELHLHWYLLADILTELGRVLSAQEIAAPHRAAIQEAAAALRTALAASGEAGSAASG
ncbi:hypothetical protein [Benzoatithermus flavus]|uniref:Uncharacterized protein n=1 Tax=Benzoatithermus flavus TaxID=3108223 RepID=A0ABU8XU53_9PROT